ncbi:hypothetical protein [Halorussus marinus]|uniref:hypothetical protein n=1 Tax=Halorussus marinus TaxID=2505976 RepID=UPI001092BB09|nr:hypothetical protein [Halorussus marinus]
MESLTHPFDFILEVGGLEFIADGNRFTSVGAVDGDTVEVVTSVVFSGTREEAVACSQPYMNAIQK